MSLKIAHIIHSLDPAGGGPAAVVGQLGAAQSALGHEVHFLTTGNPDRAQAVHASLQSIPGIEGVRRHDLPAVGLRDALRDSAAARAWRDGLEPMDVLHLHGVWEPLLLMTARMAQAWGKPYIIAPHGMLYPWSLNQKRAKKRLALALGYRAMLNRAAFIHVLNGDEREAVARLKLRSPMRILPNGMFESDIQSIASSPTLGERWPQWAGRPVILFLSRLHPGKGLNLLAEAFAQVTKEDAAAQLVVAGPDGPAKEPFEQRVRDLGIAERVHLIGPVYGQDKYALMAAATCFCLPSAHETFSMAITEALTCGTPVVISENCHFPEVAEAGAGRVVPLEAPAVAGGLLEILRDADLRQRMGEAGRQLVLSRFTWPAIARQTIEAYENSRRPAVGRGQ